MDITPYGAGIFSINHFLTAAECADFIQRSETKGFVEAEVSTFDGPALRKDIRNNDRIIVDDPTLAALWFERIRRYLPATLGDCQLHGLNERFRFYRYHSGQFFKWHKDGSFHRNEHEFSLLTLLVYLNDDFLGGETAFRFEQIKPSTGTALVFPHLLMHQGNPIVEGIKYVLRTDVMYRVADA